MSEVDIKTIDTDDPGIYDIDCDLVDCWRIEDSCTLGRRTAFSHDGRLWMAWSEEPNVFWQPVDID